MHPHSSTPHALQSINARRGVILLSGYGLTATVEHGRLCLSDGVALSRRSSRFSKATCGIKRLVIHGSNGVISLKALRWLHDIGAAIVNVDADGELILAYSPQVEGATRLRRAQVAASGQDLATQILRHLLQEKVSGQADVAEKIGEPSAALTIWGCLAAMKEADIESLAFREAHAAATYWKAWSTVRMKFARRDDPRVSYHWRSFGPRQSSISGSTRNAANPANALLNYLYAILEAETRIALLTVGLDPGLGLLHTDQPSRDSLALDAMEAVRPRVDQWLYELLSRTTFAVGDFFERQDGTVRLSRNIAGILAETPPLWAREIAPVAEWVAQQLANGSPRARQKSLLPTPLTQWNRSQGRPRQLGRRAPTKPAPGMTTPRLCLECGAPVRGGDRKLCSDRCFKVYERKLAVPRFSQTGLRELRRLRAEGIDPSHGGEAAKKRGRSNARRAKARAEWEKLGLDLEEEKVRFLKEISPYLLDIPIRRIVEATGFSLYYASLVRRGIYTPHPAHYASLEVLVRAVANKVHRTGR